MEIVISVGIVGLVIPLVLGLLVVSGESGRKASDDTKAAFLARTVVQEVEFARSGNSDLIGEALAWPDFPAGGGKYVFTADVDGLNLKKGEAGTYQDGVNSPGVAYLISVQGRFVEFDKLPGANNVSQVEVSIETPAVASSENRRKRIFTQLMYPD